MKGFSSLTPEAQRVLECFNQDSIVWPVDLGLPEPQVKKAIEQLRRLGILKRGRPLTLTKKGKSLRENK
jgi:hypothetical protein